MLTCYLDDSDADTGSVLTIAGYLADEAGWLRFGDRVEALCREMKVDVIHAREFDAQKDCFKGWTVIDKVRFLHGIADAMQGNVRMGISRSIPKALYKVRKVQSKLDSRLSAYGFAFGTIVFSLFKANEFGISEEAADGVRFLVEDGNRNNRDLDRYVQSEIRHGNLPATTSISFIGKRSCRAIQVADLYAFYSRRRANKWIKTRGKLRYFPDNYQLHVQRAIPHHTGMIADPVTEATNLRTGEKFGISGMVTAI